MTLAGLELLLLLLFGTFEVISQLIQTCCVSGMPPNSEVNSKMNNKIDGSVTPKPESKSKVSVFLKMPHFFAHTL